jgi:hypothetical protein
VLTVAAASLAAPSSHPTIAIGVSGALRPAFFADSTRRRTHWYAATVAASSPPDTTTASSASSADTVSISPPDRGTTNQRRATVAACNSHAARSPHALSATPVALSIATCTPSPAMRMSALGRASRRAATCQIHGCASTGRLPGTSGVITAAPSLDADEAARLMTASMPPVEVGS